MQFDSCSLTPALSQCLKLNCTFPPSRPKTLHTCKPTKHTFYMFYETSVPTLALVPTQSVEIFCHIPLVTSCFHGGPSELPAEFLRLPLLGVEGVLCVLELFYNLLGLLHLHGELRVLLHQLLVLSPELHHQLAQLLALLSAVQLQLLHFRQSLLHALHQALQLVLRHLLRFFESPLRDFPSRLCLLSPVLMSLLASAAIIGSLILNSLLDSHGTVIPPCTVPLIPLADLPRDVTQRLILLPRR